MRTVQSEFVNDITQFYHQAFSLCNTSSEYILKKKYHFTTFPKYNIYIYNDLHIFSDPHAKQISGGRTVHFKSISEH